MAQSLTIDIRIEVMIARILLNLTPPLFTDAG